MLTVAYYTREVIPRVYVPVLRELMTKDELASLKLSIRASGSDMWLHDAAELPPDAVIGTDEEMLAVEVHGELQLFWLASSMTDEENRERFYSDLQD